MMSGAKKMVPKRRFKEFLNTGSWEQRKFGELMTFLNGRAYKQDELLRDGMYKVLRVGNFYTNDSWYYSDLELDDKYYAKNGDLLYTWSATFGPHIWKGEKVIYHYHIWKLVLQDKIDKLFALQLLEVDKASIISDKNGSTMVHITKQGMENKQTILPISLNEQKRIAKFLSSMDNLITLHQLKLDKLEATKKALLQEMFPEEGQDKPKRRFKGFTDAWEQRELSSLTEYIGTGKSQFAIKEFGEYAILGSTNVIGYDDAYDYDGNFILTARVGANAGQLYQYSGKVKITDNTVFLMSDRSQFIYYTLTHFDLRRLSFGTGQPLVKSSELQKLKLCVPVSKSEQEKIGEIFNNIDNIITLHQRKLDKLNNLKQAYLNEMFV
jgi:hypothetical protein